MDRLTPERRSWLMSRIKGRNTEPEMAIRRIVFAMGFRYRLHTGGLPGTPDLAFGKLRKVIFVHGCFWHGHIGCRYGKIPKSRIEFWKRKIRANRNRDRKVLRHLKSINWNGLVIWQCELKQPNMLVRKIHDFLKNGK
jgi:DNA mismatch endonuclease (patch repair protein)